MIDEPQTCATCHLNQSLKSIASLSVLSLKKIFAESDNKIVHAGVTRRLKDEILRHNIL